MKNIAGMMMPEMNCAPNAASNSSSFLLPERLLHLVLAAEDLDQPWPVKVSSMCPLSSPVCFHCAMNCFCDRLPIAPVITQRQRHRDQRDDRQQRRDVEHHRHHADDGEQRGQQLAQRLLQQALRDVVDVVGDPAEQLTAGLLVEVRQRQPVELVLDVGAQLVDRALHHAVEHLALRPGQQRGDDVDASTSSRIAAELPKSMPRPGSVGLARAARRSCPGRRRGPVGRLVERDALGQPAAEYAGEDEVGRGPRIFGPIAVSATLTSASSTMSSTAAARAQPAQQPLGRGAERHRLLRPARRSAMSAAADRGTCGPRRCLGRLLLLRTSVLGGHAAASTV